MPAPKGLLDPSTTVLLLLFYPALASAQSISLSVSNIPAPATQVSAVVDGGSIPGNQPVIATAATGGAGQISMSVGVPSGGPYRVRAIAVTGTGAILRSGQAGSISVAAGGSSSASITLQDVTATVGAAAWLGRCHAALKMKKSSPRSRCRTL